MFHRIEERSAFVVCVVTLCLLLIAMPAVASMNSCIKGAVNNTVKVGMGALIAVGLDCVFLACALTSTALATGSPLVLGTFGALGYGCADGLLEEPKSTSPPIPSTSQQHPRNPQLSR